MLALPSLNAIGIVLNFHLKQRLRVGGGEGNDENKRSDANAKNVLKYCRFVVLLSLELI